MKIFDMWHDSLEQFGIVFIELLPILTIILLVLFLIYIII